MRRYTIIHPLYMSFFSKSLYRDVAKNWRGLCLWYLISLLALCLIPEVMAAQTDLSDYLAKEAPKIVKQFPTVTIAKGKVSIDKPEPYFILDEKTRKPIIIFDNTGKITSLDGTSAGVLVTGTAVIVKKGAAETRSFDLSDVDNFTLNRTSIYNIMDAFEEWFAVMIYPFALLFSFLFHSIEVLIFALCGNLFLRLSHRSLPFRALFRLAAISITPVMIAGTILFAGNLEVPQWWLLSFLVSLGYLFFGLRAALEESGTANG